jgi:hypothetical protein
MPETPPLHNQTPNERPTIAWEDVEDHKKAAAQGQDQLPTQEQQPTTQEVQEHEKLATETQPELAAEASVAKEQPTPELVSQPENNGYQEEQNPTTIQSTPEIPVFLQIIETATANPTDQALSELSQMVHRASQERAA